MSDIRRYIHDNRRYIEEKAYKFVGRQFIFEEIAQFIAKESCGYFIIQGYPGIGKTALAAQLVKTHGYIHHFNIRVQRINRAQQFLTNVCAQLIARYKLDNLSLSTTEDVQDGRTLNRLLDEVSSKLVGGEKAVIVVDALDEVDNLENSDDVNILYLPRTLPPGIFFITTMRREKNLIPHIDCANRQKLIGHDTAENLADIRAHIERATISPDIHAYIVSQSITYTQFVDLLAEKSQGNFMYLHYVLPEIEGGAYKDLQLDVLPSGLENYYEYHWKRMRSQGEEWFDYGLPIVMALTEAKEPISVELIEKFTGIQKRARIRKVLDDWTQFLGEEKVPYEKGLQVRYHIYHASFHEFIAAKEEVKDERINREMMRRKISGVLWDGWLESEQTRSHERNKEGIRHKREMFQAKERRLRELERWQARKGLDTEPHILIEIEELRTDLDNLRQIIIDLQSN